MKIAILLCNIGTPDAPTTSAVRRYLKEFLSDPRVIELPPLLWQPILRVGILTTRPQKSAKLYQKIWTSEGSPLLSNTIQLANHLSKVLTTKTADEIIVRTAMRYGNPNIKTVLAELQADKIDRLLVLPLFPQYSATTTAACFDATVSALRKWRHLPALTFINDYASHQAYISAISDSIREYWQTHGQKFLLFSFHGIPQRYIDAGDPYATACHTTATLVAQQLKLKESAWTLAFQSRLGPTKWLLPYTDKVLAALPGQGIKELQVVCPGFAVDCLETLEEIAIRGREQFLGAGGKTLEYIPALNASSYQVTMLSEILLSALKTAVIHTTTTF
ncbi:MAG: ferrochelatase [Pseudomonadota bacterium]